MRLMSAITRGVNGFRPSWYSQTQTYTLIVKHGPRPRSSEYKIYGPRLRPRSSGYKIYGPRPDPTLQGLGWGLGIPV